MCISAPTLHTMLCEKPKFHHFEKVYTCMSLCLHLCFLFRSYCAALHSTSTLPEVIAVSEVGASSSPVVATAAHANSCGTHPQQRLHGLNVRTVLIRYWEDNVTEVVAHFQRNWCQLAVCLTASACHSENEYQNRCIKLPASFSTLLPTCFQLNVPVIKSTTFLYFDLNEI